VTHKHTLSLTHTPTRARAHTQNKTYVEPNTPLAERLDDPTMKVHARVLTHT